MSGQGSASDSLWIRSAVERYQGPLLQYAGRIVGGPEAAGDVVQETFVRLCAQERAKVEPILAEWLYCVCRNCAIDVKRKARRMSLLGESQADELAGAGGVGGVGDAGAGDDPASVAEDRDATAVALKLLDRLPTNQEEVIRLKFQHGLSYKQIAQVTNLTVTNVGFLIHRGLKTLREQMTAGLTRS